LHRLFHQLQELRILLQPQRLDRILDRQTYQLQL
jgi:hypothetical protein